MIHVRARTADGACHTDPPLEFLHPLIEDERALIWLDLESPSPDEIALVAGLCGWEHLTVEDLTKQGQRAKLEQFPTRGYSLLVMHALEYQPDTSSDDRPRLATPEVDFVIGRNYIVTVHYVPLPHVAESRQVAQFTEAMLSRGADYLLYVLVDRLVDSYFPVLDAIDDEVDWLEDTIVSDPSHDLRPRIFDMKRDAVKLRKVVNPQLEVFTQLTNPHFGVVTEPNVIYFRDVHDHLIRIFEAAESHREMLSGALDAYLSTLSNRMNEVMKRLTVMAALFLPITFLTGLIGMNLPINGAPVWKDRSFWVLLAAMALFSAVQFAYFRRKSWV